MTELTRAEIFDVLHQIFSDLFDANVALTDATTAAEVGGWDSLQQIKIILAIEKRLKVRLRPREFNALRNVGEMVTYLQQIAKHPLQK